MILIVLPWISRLKLWNLSSKAAEIYPNQNGIFPDIFLYYKEVFLIVAGIAMLLFLVGENIFPDKIRTDTPLKDKQNRWILVCVLLYSCSVVLSALFSVDRYTTLMGGVTEGEGVFAVVSYMLLFLGAMNYFCEEKALRLLQRALVVLMGITILLACVEFIGGPLFEHPFLRNLLAGEEYRTYLSGMKNTSYRNFVTLTFYNPNYFGGFCLLLLPYAQMFLLKSTKNCQRIGYGVLTAGMIFCVIAAKSTTSVYLALGELLALTCVTWFSDGKQRKNIGINLGISLALSVLLLLSVNAASGGRLWGIAENALTNQSRMQEQEVCYPLTDIRMEDNCLILCGKSSELIVEAKDGVVRFYDGTGEAIDSQVTKEGALELTGEGYERILVTATGNQLMFELGYDTPVSFYLENDVFYGVGQNGAHLTEVSSGNLTRRFGVKAYAWFTGRGYAWVNTLPLLKETLLIGKGAGNFALCFPQNDYVGLLNTHGSSRFYVDKPHSMYLQTLVNHGGIAFGALLVLFVGSFLQYRKVRRGYGHQDVNSLMGDASFVSFVAFAGYSCLNDSIVTVNPTFWILFGVMQAVISKMRK